MGVEGDEVLIEIEDGGKDVTIGLQFDWLSDAKLILTDELIAEMLRQRKVALPEDGGFDDMKRSTKPRGMTRTTSPRDETLGSRTMAITSANQLETVADRRGGGAGKDDRPGSGDPGDGGQPRPAAKSRYGAEMDIRVKIDRKTAGPPLPGCGPWLKMRR